MERDSLGLQSKTMERDSLGLQSERDSKIKVTPKL